MILNMLIKLKLERMIMLRQFRLIVETITCSTDISCSSLAKYFMSSGNILETLIKVCQNNADQNIIMILKKKMYFVIFIIKFGIYARALYELSI